jgi:hypothetical protein
MLAMHVARKKHEDAKYEQLKERVDADFQLLAEFPHYWLKNLFRAWFLENTASRQTADEAWLEGIRSGFSGWTRYHAASAFFRRNDVDGAKELLVGDQRLEKIALAQILSADRQNVTEVERMYAELAAKDQDETVRFFSGAAIEVLTMLGDTEQLQEEAKRVLELRAFGSEFDEQMLRYLAGEIGAEALIRQTGENQNNLSMAHFLVARVELGKGNRQTALEHLDGTLDTWAYTTGDYYWAKAFRDRLDDDPQWPAWIETTSDSSESGQ